MTITFTEHSNVSDVFADSYDFIALLNQSDVMHARAKQVEAAPSVRIVTTQWVVTELADGLAERPHRNQFSTIFRYLTRHPRVVVVPLSADVFDRAIDLYVARPDKR